MSEGFGIESVDTKQSSPTPRKPTEVVDIRCIQQNLVERFADIEDPRVERTKKHQLTDILVIAILANHCGSARLGRH